MVEDLVIGKKILRVIALFPKEKNYIFFSFEENAAFKKKVYRFMNAVRGEADKLRRIKLMLGKLA